eukprot:4569439-Pleurochrysis_carterae.AAC.1
MVSCFSFRTLKAPCDRRLDKRSSTSFYLMLTVHVSSFANTTLQLGVADERACDGAVGGADARRAHGCARARACSRVCVRARVGACARARVRAPWVRLLAVRASARV